MSKTVANKSQLRKIYATAIHGNYPLVIINNVLLQSRDSAKYLGMTIDKCITWAEHIKLKKAEITIRYKKFNWLLGRRSKLSLENKLLTNKTFLKPVWMYGVEIWVQSATAI